MRKHELVRKIAEHMVDENVFEETALEELPREIIRMRPEQIELKKIRIQARIELGRNKMELERAKIQQETRLREVPGSFLRRAPIFGLWRQIKIKRSPDEQPFKRVWELVNLDIVIPKRGFIFLHVWGRGGLALDPS